MYYSVNKSLSHDDYVRYQFYCGKNRFVASYKNVFLHTSLVEGLIVSKSEEANPYPDEKEKENNAKYRTFRYALVILKKLLGDEYKILHVLYDDRNDLIHDITKLDQNAIEEKIRKMWVHIVEVYKGSEFLNELFGNRYNFSPKSIFINHQPELADDTSNKQTGIPRSDFLNLDESSD